MSNKCFLIQNFTMGGAENYLLRYLNYIQDASNSVVTYDGDEGDLRDDYSKVSTLVCNFYISRHHFSGYVKLYKYFKKNKIDVVCDFHGNFSAFTMFVAKIAGVKKRVAFYRESRNQFKPSILKNLYARFLKNLMYFSSTDILSNSQAALDYFHPKRNPVKKNFKVIYNGVDIDKLSKMTSIQIREKLRIPLDAFVIGHNGRYALAKNQKLIIEVAVSLCTKYHDIYFVLVGNDLSTHFSYIIPKELQNRILFLGYRKDVLDILKCYDLFYFPSFNEGQPNALIEALLSGVPCLGSSIPAIKETVPPAMYESLVNPFDKNANLSSIENLYLNREKLNFLKAEEWAKSRFNAKQQFDKFYNVLINQQ